MKNKIKYLSDIKAAPEKACNFVIYFKSPVTFQKDKYPADFITF
ncbi:Putative uncharacterized protein [Moritella viscosa]|nr:Putative uncharacterized protein [Moritella viscosa]SHO19872.1 Putative uncharacterized protein [Moritella viscosa]